MDRFESFLPFTRCFLLPVCGPARFAPLKGPRLPSVASFASRGRVKSLGLRVPWWFPSVQPGPEAPGRCLPPQDKCAGPVRLRLRKTAELRPASTRSPRAPPPARVLLAVSLVPVGCRALLRWCLVRVARASFWACRRARRARCASSGVMGCRWRRGPSIWPSVWMVDLARPFVSPPCTGPKTHRCQ